MLGHKVVQHLSSLDKFEVLDISFRRKLRQNTVIVDAMNGADLTDTVVRIDPDFIINCIGVLVGGSQDEGRAIYLNSYLPHQLKKIAKDIDARLIHISTDCVFSGLKGQYIESDFRDGRGVYARTKILGEIIDNTNLTLRTSIVGPELKHNGEGIFHWFVNQSTSVFGYQKSIWSGVTTLELAKVIERMIDNNVTGLHHITNNTPISKYNLLLLFQKYTGKNINVLPVEGEKYNKSLVDTVGAIDYKIPSYDQMIKEMVLDIKLHSELYRYDIM